MAARSETQKPRYYVLATVTLAMSTLGAVMIPSASSAMAYMQKGDSFFFAWRQFAWLAVGLALMLFFSRVDYRQLRFFAWPALGMSVALLVVVSLIGEEANGASRWIPIGPGFQPSEFAKVAVVFGAASYFERLGAAIKEPARVIWPFGATVILLAVLVYKQPDLGTTIILLSTAFVVWFLAGGTWLQTLTALATGLIGVAVAIMTSDYRRARFLSFLNPWAVSQGSGYQIIQGLYALGSGGLTGVGLGLSRQKFGYLPAAHTDFILAVIGEEMGLIATLSIIGMFLVFLITGMRIAATTRDRFGRLLAGGLTTMIGMQAAVNIGGVVGWLPITGVPLPFISYGGTSLVVSLAASGMLLSVAAHGRRKAKSGPKRANNDLRWGDRGPHLPRISAS